MGRPARLHAASVPSVHLELASYDSPEIGK